MQGVQVRSLVGELCSHMPQGLLKNQNINKLNKDFKNGPHQKKKKKNRKWSQIRGDQEIFQQYAMWDPRLESRQKQDSNGGTSKIQ